MSEEQEQQASAQQEQPKPQEQSALSEDRVKGMISEAVAAAVMAMQRNADNSSGRRGKKGQAQEAQAAAAPESELEAMRRTIEQMQKAQDEERESRAVADRDSALRRAIEGHGVSSVEGVYRYVRGDLSVGENGEYYGKGLSGEYTNLDKYVGDVIRANKWMQGVSGRGGGGGVGQGVPQNQSAQTITMAQYTDKLRELSNDQPARAKFLADVMSGKLQVK